MKILIADKISESGVDYLREQDGIEVRLDARPDSTFCHLHDTEKAGASGGEGEAACDSVEFGDLVPLLAAGAMAVGLLLFMKSFGKLIPRF